jgi:hypothetical protein
MPAIETLHAKSKEEVKQDTIQQVVNTPDVTDDEYMRLKEKSDKTPNKNAIVHRRALWRKYNWVGKITPEFVKLYDDEQQKKWYCNLNTIKNKTLNKIQAEEREHHEAHSERVGNLNKTYYFEHYWIAMSILLVLGWTGLDDKKTISKALIEAAIAENKNAWKAQHTQCEASTKPHTDNYKSK